MGCSDELITALTTSLGDEAYVTELCDQLGTASTEGSNATFLMFSVRNVVHYIR